MISRHYTLLFFNTFNRGEKTMDPINIGHINSRNFDRGYLILRFNHTTDVISVVDDEGNEYEAKWQNQVYIVDLN